MEKYFWYQDALEAYMEYVQTRRTNQWNLYD